MADEIKIAGVSALSKVGGDIQFGGIANSSSTFKGTIDSTATFPTNTVHKVSAVVNNNRTNIQGTNVRQYQWGTFTKDKTTTKLMFTGTLLFHDQAGNDSDATGLYVGFSTGYNGPATLKKRSLSRIDVTGSNFRERFAQTTGFVAASDLAAGQWNVVWGTDSSSSYIGSIWNPNASDDNRYVEKRESTLLIWEVL